MQVAVVGRGKLGSALGLAARAAGHEATLLRRPGAAPNAHSPLPERALDGSLEWDAFDLVLLAFEKKTASAAELEKDPTLVQLRRIPVATPVASVVMSPAPEVVDAFLAGRAIVHFLTTPAAQLEGAIALLPQGSLHTTPLRRALPGLHWIEAQDPADYRRLAVLMVGSAIAVAALGHLGRLLGGAPTASEGDYLQHVLDDAKRILRLNEGDGFSAFASVATPGGFTEALHNQIFAQRWPLED